MHQSLVVLFVHRQMRAHISHRFELLAAHRTYVDLVALMRPLMHLAVATLRKALGTEGTNVGPFARVSASVILQHVERCEPHGTQVTGIGSLACVLALVLGQGAAGGESGGADLTLIRLDTGVGARMGGQLRFGYKRMIAQLALETLYVRMAHHVLA